MPTLADQYRAHGTMLVDLLPDRDLVVSSSRISTAPKVLLSRPRTVFFVGGMFTAGNATRGQKCVQFRAI